MISTVIRTGTYGNFPGRPVTQVGVERASCSCITSSGESCAAHALPIARFCEGSDDRPIFVKIGPFGLLQMVEAVSAYKRRRTTDVLSRLAIHWINAVMPRSRCYDMA